MTVTAKTVLKEQQRQLAEQYSQWEAMQTDYSYDEDFYRYCQWKMQDIDEEMEMIRRVLEMGCCE